MTLLFRSKSCGLGRTTINSVFESSPPTSSLYLTKDDEETEDEEEEETEDDDEYFRNNPITTPFIVPEHHHRHDDQNQDQGNNQFPPIFTILAAALRKSLLVTCSAETQDFASSMDIGCPTDVRHVSHVTFDRFNGFLGLPVELQPQLPRKVPSARSHLLHSNSFVFQSAPNLFVCLFVFSIALTVLV